MPNIKETKAQLSEILCVLNNKPEKPVQSACKEQLLLEKDLKKELQVDSRVNFSQEVKKNSFSGWKKMADNMKNLNSIGDRNIREMMTNDDKLLKQKSMAVKQYLNDNLMPELTEVVVEICKNKPKDPVEFAINYLSKKIEREFIN